MKGTQKTTERDVGSLCQDFIRDIETLADTLPFIMTVLGKTENAIDSELDSFIDRCGRDVRRTKTGREYQIRIEDKPLHDKLHRRLSIFHGSLHVTPAAFFVALISEYDAYLGQLIRAMFYQKPELLNSTERAMTFAELSGLKTVDAAKEFVVEKEVESVLRKSHVQQFEWMEKAFSVPLRKGLDCWPRFVEATERRNLIVHCDGIASTQYLTVCREQKVDLPPELDVGTQLDVDPSYFEITAHCLTEIGVKLAHVLWRKLCPSAREKADQNLIEITYDLLLGHKYRMASELLRFATDTVKDHSSDEVRRMFVVNSAIAAKYSGEKDKATAMLDKEDWTACDDKFQLATAVLRDDFDRAVELMLKIGRNGEDVGRFAYHEWPLFREFRKTKKFLSTYKKIFREEFTLKESEPPRSGPKQQNGTGRTTPPTLRRVPRRK